MSFVPAVASVAPSDDSQESEFHAVGKSANTGMRRIAANFRWFGIFYC